MQVMTMEDERRLIVKALESIFTGDGRERPEKTRLFLKLVNDYGMAQVVACIKEISERKAF